MTYSQYIINATLIFAKFSSNSNDSLNSLTLIWYDKTRYAAIAGLGFYVGMHFVFL